MKNHQQSLVASVRPGATSLLATVLIATTVLYAPSASATSDTRAERERVRRRQAAAAAELDVLRAEDARVEAALEALAVNAGAQQSRLAAAEAAARAAEAQAQGARNEEAAVATTVRELRDDLRNIAVRSYMHGRREPAEVPDDGLDVSSAVRRDAFEGFVIGSANDVQDKLHASQEDLALARERAEAAAVVAGERRRAAADRLAELTRARDAQAAFAVKLDERIEGRLAEAAALARLDQQLSATIQRQQEELARRNTARVLRPVSGGTPLTSRGSVPLRSVRGISVHESLAEELEALLAAAEADGLMFGGGGYRDSEDQRRLRRANCPDPEASPASSCSPPTARPGQSMHERGLAVDFTYQGRIISSRSSPGYRWLDANAARYGLYNLPSEPWHWSTNGD